MLKIWGKKFLTHFRAEEFEALSLCKIPCGMLFICLRC